jgi:hypothetical protein
VKATTTGTQVSIDWSRGFLVEIQTLRSAGKTTSQKLTLRASHTHIIGIFRKTLNRPKRFGHTLWLIRELQKKLGAYDIPTERRTHRTNLTGDRATARALEKEVVELVAPHELENTRGLLLLLLT